MVTLKKSKVKKIAGFILMVGEEREVIANEFSGDSVELCPEAVALYDFIKGCEVVAHYKDMEKALKYFRQHWPEEYMILLD